MSGVLYVVGTPIGNLEDMSQRGIAALERSELIGCEDTRRTGKLLELLGLEKTKLVRMDEHTEHEVAERLVDAVRGGRVVAIVSDAGMPALSDPGAEVVSLANSSGVRVEVISGPFAAAHAAVASGLLDKAGRFQFDGFLPRKGQARADILADISSRDVATVFYESPYRVTDTVEDLLAVCRETRLVALCRELTKMHEEVWSGSMADAVAKLATDPPKGEFAVVVAPAEAPAEVSDDLLLAEVRSEISDGASRKDAASLVARRHGVAHNRVKRLALEG